MRKIFFFLSIMIVIMLFSHCKGSYYAYKRHLFIPKQSNIQKCMGKSYEGYNVNTSMRYYYSKRK